MVDNPSSVPHASNVPVMLACNLPPKMAKVDTLHPAELIVSFVMKVRRPLPLQYVDCGAEKRRTPCGLVATVLG